MFFINKGSRVSHDLMVSLQHFFIRQSRKWNTKRRKLFIQCQHFKVAQKQERKWHFVYYICSKNKKWRSPFCFRGRWLGHCLVCKSISSCTHVSTHTFLIRRRDSPSVQSSLGDEVKELWNLLVLLRFPQPADFFYSVISYVSQNDLTTPWGLAFHFSNRWTDRRWDQQAPTERKLKTPCLIHVSWLRCNTVDYWVLSVAKFVASSPCMIVKYW